MVHMSPGHRKRNAQVLYQNGDVAVDLFANFRSFDVELERRTKLDLSGADADHETMLLHKG